MANQTRSHASRADASEAQRKDRTTDPGDAAQEVKNEAQSKATAVKDKVVDESKRAKEELKEQAQGFFDELKEAVADQVERLSSALRGAEREFDDHRLEDLATMPREVADRIDDVSAYLRDRSGRGMRNDFEQAVAREPVAVAAGLAVVGATIAWALRKDRARPTGDPGDDSRGQSSGSAGGGRSRRGGQ